jgi:Na+/H+ antiporter NhaD/arsenite permease-like protein
MLLMTPITVQIALSVGVNPLALLIPELMASNVIGVSTLVGTPTNILIGSYAGITFNGFLQNLTPGVIMAFLGLIGYSILIYHKELKQAHTASKTLIKKLEEGGQITQPGHLKKAGWVFGAMLLMFIFGERIHLLPSVTAIIGATALLLWIRPNIEEMIEAVDWTTLVFFMSLFIVVGAVQEVGLISIIADWIGILVGENLLLAMFVITWLSALLSMIIANIPFTAAMLPVVGFLTSRIPGAESGVLFFCLSIGSALGGNGTLIGASANMVTVGIAEAAGYRISYSYFLKKGFPAVLITVGLAFLWLLVKFL